MPNFFQDNDDIQFHFDRMDLRELVRLMEDDYSYASTDPVAPVDYDDARDNYRRVLDLIGEIAGDFIAPRAEQVDIDGPKLEDGEVTYAPGIAESLDLLGKAQMMGFTLPRKYGGLNIPNTIYMMATEMVSRADASLMNLCGLGEIAETIHSFGTDEIKDRILPRMVAGEATAAMVLTEPDAGSDLQVVQLKATPTDDPEKWLLNGVKRGITNGCGDILLVLTRSEEGTEDARGLSLFLVEKCPQVMVRRIEDKLGIHGSPTCELVFKDAPALLIGRRKRGLIRYVMALMNGARVAIAAQSVGIAEAGYRAALGFARERRQFGKEIIHFPAVYDMLATMKLRVQAARTLAYNSSLAADMERILGRRLDEKRPDDDNKALRGELSRWSKLASTLAPMAKYYASEICNSVCYDAIQVLGGSGFMRDYSVERYYRDARITSIYEGTSQLQVIAAIGGVMSGVLDSFFDECAARSYDSTLRDLAKLLVSTVEHLHGAVAHVKERSDRAYTEYHSRRIVDLAIGVYVGYQFLDEAAENDTKKVLAHKFITDLASRARMDYEIIYGDDTTIAENYEALLNDRVD